MPSNGLLPRRVDFLGECFGSWNIWKSFSSKLYNIKLSYCNLRDDELLDSMLNWMHLNHKSSSKCLYVGMFSVKDVDFL